MNAPSRLDRALTQYTRATVRIGAAARDGGGGDLAAMLRARRQWESEARAQGASTEDIETASLTGLT
jgi:hypothetical protein